MSGRIRILAPRSAPSERSIALAAVRAILLHDGIDPGMARESHEEFLLLRATGQSLSDMPLPILEAAHTWAEAQQVVTRICGTDSGFDVLMS